MGRMLAVASGKGGVGKSTVAVQLASALARAGRQVLLVDGDIGMRCLDLMLGLTDSLAFDLSDILLGRCTAQEVILKSSAFGVSLLPAPLNSLPELSGFKPLLTELTDAYDFVILDLPAGPLNTAELLPRFCEGLVVSNPGSIPLRDAAKTVQAFQSFGVAQVRLVLNRVTRAELKKPAWQFRRCNRLLQSAVNCPNTRKPGPLPKHPFGAAACKKLLCCSGL